jgi:hypothetical protein
MRRAYFFPTSDSTLESAGPITLTARETEQEPLLFMLLLATLKTASFILCALISIPHSAGGRCCVALRLYLYTTGKVRGTFELACEVCVYSEREVLGYARCLLLIYPWWEISLK